MATRDDVREERRRRIVERGSDRIALITGRRGQNLPSSEPSAEGHACDSSSSSQRDSQILHANDRIRGTFEDSEAPARDTDGSGGRQIEANKAISETDTGGIQLLPSHDRTGPAASALPRQRPILFSSKRLNSCILESERTRGCCAFIIAVLVVLSYVGYPLFGSHIVKSGSVVASRPLYILLLTDVTIVLARFLSAQRSPEEAVDERKAPREENQNWDGAVKVLERGLVAYQTVRAVFIDCSIYMVVVICGLSHL